MRIKIDKDGYLEIERAGEMMAQECPFSDGNRDCGDHCPLFGEPDMEEGGSFVGSINLCHNRYLGGEIIDERGKS